MSSVLFLLYCVLCPLWLYLQAIVEYPSSKPLTQDELDLVWKYRAYLSSQRKALPKFLRSVIDWHGAQSSGELKEALELLANWERIDVYDALELLSPDFQHPAVRRYAVSVLETAQDRVRYVPYLSVQSAGLRSPLL